MLGPADPDKVAKEISDRMGAPVAITDINDLEGQILGTSPRRTWTGIGSARF